MAVAALTPRVRTIVICDEVTASLTEDSVFTLEGVRYHVQANSFPWRVGLSLFLLLSCPRKGNYSGKVLVVNDRNNKPIRYVKFRAPFDNDQVMLPVVLEIGECVFPESGQYTFEIYLAGRDGEALKGEHPLTLLTYED